MNVIAYIIYLGLSFWITIYVGKVIFLNGRHFLLNMMNQNEEMADSVNKMLLVGYYLINLGYITLMISFWETIQSPFQLIESLSKALGQILLTLALLHYFNMLTITLWNKFNRQSYKSS